MANAPPVTVLAGPSKEDITRWARLSLGANRLFRYCLLGFPVAFSLMLAGVASPAWTEASLNCRCGLFAVTCDGEEVVKNPRTVSDNATLQSVLSLSIIAMLLIVISFGLAIQMRRATQESMIKKCGVLSAVFSAVGALMSIIADILYSTGYTPVITPTPFDNYPYYPILGNAFVLHVIGATIALIYGSIFALVSTKLTLAAARHQQVMVVKTTNTIVNYMQTMAVVEALNRRYLPTPEQQQQQRLQQRLALYDGKLGPEDLGTSPVSPGDVTTEFEGGHVELGTDGHVKI